MTSIGCLTITSVSYASQPPDVVHSDGAENTAMGTNALLHLSSGSENTAAGDSALESNTTGTSNTAAGTSALFSNTDGVENTAYGAHALFTNTTGFDNTASGESALYSNSTGSFNTALGHDALLFNGNGFQNTATGTSALIFNTSGSYNTATGAQALFNNTTGNHNTALGFDALPGNKTGHDNAAAGYQALHLATGSNNVGVGMTAGSQVTTGSNNIEIANTGIAGDNGKIRIGTQGIQNTTYIAGISGTHVTGLPVYVMSTGQLGVLASSERYKTAVAPMGSRTEKLRELRPVTFRLKTFPRGGIQYGLIAEEVARVYPELVIRDDKGRTEGVRYEELTPMLLNEVRKQAKVIDALTARLSKLEEQQALGRGAIDSH